MLKRSARERMGIMHDAVRRAYCACVPKRNMEPCVGKFIYTIVYSIYHILYIHMCVFVFVCSCVL